MKIVLPTITNGQDLSALNNNFASIAAALNTNVLYRKNIAGEDNTMQNDLDFNGYRAYNLADVLVNGISVLTVATNAQNAASSASASAAAALASQIASASSQAAAAQSAIDAASAAGQAGSLIAVNNLSDVPNKVTARLNLGLDQVNNTSDANKPVSTAQQTALNLKAPIASPTFTGTVTVPTGFNVKNAAGQANFNIDGSVGNSRQFQFMTSGSVRWTVATDQTAEAGGNLGSDFGIYRFDNTGAYIDNPLKFFRNSGQATFSVRPIFGAATPYDTANLNIASYAPLASPALTGTATLVNATYSGLITPSTIIGIKGTTLADNAQAGSVGEYLTNTVTGTSVTTGVVGNASILNLTAGDWDVWGSVKFIPAATTTVGQLLLGITTTSATIPSDPNVLSLTLNFPTGVAQFLSAPMQRINVAAGTNVWIAVYTSFGVSTMTVNGTINARRVR
jgi:hypothetical protein